MAQSLANNSKQFLKWLEGMFVLRCFQYYRNAKSLFLTKQHMQLLKLPCCCRRIQKSQTNATNGASDRTLQISAGVNITWLWHVILCQPYTKFVLLHAGIKVKFIHLLMDCSLVPFVFRYFSWDFQPAKSQESGDRRNSRGFGPVEIATNSVAWATLTKLEVIQAGSFKFLVYSWWLIEKNSTKKKASGNAYVFELTFI